MGYVTAVLEAFKLIKELVDMAKALSSFIQANKDEAWFKNSADVFQRLRDAKTPEEHKAVGKDLAKQWGQL